MLYQLQKPVLKYSKYLDIGTGKTTTLIRFSEIFVKKNPDAKLLYCVFNRYVNYCTIILHTCVTYENFVNYKICYEVCQEAVSKSCRCTNISFTSI